VFVNAAICHNFSNSSHYNASNNDINMASNTVSFKFVLTDGVAEPEVRRFTVDRHIGTSLVLIQKLLASAYPNLGFKPFRLTWTDADGDKVTIGSDVELATAMEEMKGPVYKFNVEVKNEKRQATPEVCQSFSCDACERPIVGTRYRCVSCPDYDLCKDCEESGAHFFHNMVRMAAPKKVYPQLYLSVPRNVASHKPVPTGAPRHDVIGWLTHQDRRGSNPSCQAPHSKPLSAKTETVVETPLETMIRNLIDQNRSEIQKPAKPQATSSGSHGMSLQKVNTPFGQMFCWMPTEEKKEVRNQNQGMTKAPEKVPAQEVPKECVSRSKANTPERDTAKPGQKTSLDKSPKPEILEVLLIETPFGRMFYLVPSEDEDNKAPVQAEKKAEQASAMAEAQRESTPAPEVQMETASKSKSPTPERESGQRKQSPNLMSVLDGSLRPEGVELQLVDTPFGRMYFWVRNTPEEVGEKKPESKSIEIPINVAPAQGETKAASQPEVETKVEPEMSEQKPETEVTATEEKAAEQKSESVDETSTSAISNEAAEQQLEAKDDSEQNSPTSIPIEQNSPSSESTQQNSSTSISVDQNSPNVDPSVDEALQAMLDMGFTDDGGWLSKLLEAKGGNVGKALDDLHGPISAASA